MESLIDLDKLLDSTVDSISKNSAVVDDAVVDDAVIDTRLLRLSYSGILQLHTCPRKFQLSKLTMTDSMKTKNITFGFGHAVGTGVQCILQGNNWEDTVFAMFLAYDVPDFLDIDEKGKKSFAHAVYAVQSLQAQLGEELSHYELAIFKGKPAIELSFRITLLNGFTYRGYVDAVLRHKVTGAYLVWEQKTTKAKFVNEAMYKNSAQALGYSIILDAIATKNSEYDVMYVVYMTVTQEYQIFRFRKSLSDRALWIRQLMLDVDILTNYNETDYYPTYGENCFNYYQECEFYQMCGMSTNLITLPAPKIDPELSKVYTLELSLLDLINSQLER